MKRLFFAVLAASLLVAACDKSRDKFVGQYDGEIDVSPETIELLRSLALQNGVDPDEVEAAMTGGKIALELRDDGTCTMTRTEDDKTGLTNGTWTLNDEGTQITVHVVMDEETAAERGFESAPSRDKVLAVSEDGKTLTLEETVLRRKVKTTFTRK